jgi:tRNA G46 methylase TrmB
LVVLITEDQEGKIDFIQIFGRSRPVHTEISSGRATFLLKQAMTQPQVGFLGIEWASASPARVRFANLDVA